MKTLLDTIDNYKLIKGIKSDSKLARLFGISHSEFSRYRTGARQPGGKFLKATIKIPELKLAVISYLGRS